MRKSARSLRAARLQEAALRSALADRWTAPQSIEAALDRYLEHDLERLRDKRTTHSRAKYLRPFIAGASFEKVGDVAEELKRRLLAEGFAPATVNRRLALLRRLCNLAYKEWNWLRHPVAQRIRLLPENNQRHIYLTPAQVEQVAGLCRAPAAGDFIRLAAYSGLRLGELLRLGKDDVYRDSLIVGTESKTGRPRIVPLPKPARYLLKLIPLPITAQIVRVNWQAARKAAGLDHVRFHDLRHTYASWLAQKNVSMGTIGVLLGHTQASTTRRYAHLSPDSLRRAVAKLDR